MLYKYIQYNKTFKQYNFLFLSDTIEIPLTYKSIHNIPPRTYYTSIRMYLSQLSNASGSVVIQYEFVKPWPGM